MFKDKISDKTKGEGVTGASMIHQATERMNPNESSTLDEHGSIEGAAALLNQGMDDLDLEDEIACMNLCFKTIGLQECTEFLGGEICLQECAIRKSPDPNTIVMNQNIQKCSRLGLVRRG